MAADFSGIDGGETPVWYGAEMMGRKLEIISIYYELNPLQSPWLCEPC